MANVPGDGHKYDETRAIPMSGSIRVLQVSDCHLHADPQSGFRGVNPYDSLNAVLRTAQPFKPELLLATGDLSEDASPASYKALQVYFSRLDTKVLALPGNHDNDMLLAKTFPGSPVDSVEVSEIGRWQIIRLNSCLEGKPEGRLSDDTLRQLAQVLGYQANRPKIIALHHQPIAVGSPWIDKYRLLEAGKFLQLIDQCPGVKAVLWGHVHQVFCTYRNGVAMMGGPSSVANSLPGRQRFTTDPDGPSCRWLELKPDGVVNTGIIRPGAKFLDFGAVCGSA